MKELGDTKVIGPLLIGSTYAKSLSIGCKKPFVPINHIYQKMSENFDGSIACSAACDLDFKGRVQPSGYTEPLLHQKRLENKTSN